MDDLQNTLLLSYSRAINLLSRPRWHDIIDLVISGLEYGCTISSYFTVCHLNDVDGFRRR